MLPMIENRSRIGMIFLYWRNVRIRVIITGMRFRSLHTAMILASLPALVVANPYDGVYKQTANAECALVGVDGGALKIEDNIFYGVEVQCRMTSPIAITDMDATVYQMQCSGEGQTWTESAMLMPDAENAGLYMIWKGYAFRYDRCDEPES